MGQEYGPHVLDHGEDAGTLKAKVPIGGSNDFSFDTVGN
jgi:hypothetical protein